jgi:hypothetical protein
MKNKWVFLSLVCVAAISSSAFGTIATTSQTWTFSTESSLTADQPDGNIYGNATATVSATGNTHGELGWYAGYLGHYGYWAGDEVVVDLTIPNSPIANPYKDVWVTIIGKGHLDGALNPDGTPKYTGTGELLGTGYEVLSAATHVDDLGYTATSNGDGWLTIVFGVRIYPNPSSEKIRFTLWDSGAAVDTIIVNTACIPEPATMLLLGLGGIVSLIARKK